MRIWRRKGEKKQKIIITHFPKELVSQLRFQIVAKKPRKQNKRQSGGKNEAKSSHKSDQSTLLMWEKRKTVNYKGK